MIKQNQISKFVKRHQSLYWFIIAMIVAVSSVTALMKMNVEVILCSDANAFISFCLIWLVFGQSDRELDLSQSAKSRDENGKSLINLQILLK